MASPSTSTDRLHTVSVVIPVYMGQVSLPTLVAEIAPLATEQRTPDGHRFMVTEVLPVWDNGPDRSDLAIREQARRYPFVQPVWLSRNFGQHAATMAGMSQTSGDWIVTLDEDGAHDPANIAALLDTALREAATVVYARPTNHDVRSPARNATSRLAKQILTTLTGNKGSLIYNSFRLILGETGRTLARDAGQGAYLDVALGWIARRVTTCDLAERDEGRPSGYNLKSLFAHFGRMIVTSGTRALRIVTMTGLISGFLGVLLTVGLGITSLINPAPVAGWTSLMCLSLIGTGAILVALGITAEYVGAAVDFSMGKPLYVIGSDPLDGPLAESVLLAPAPTPALAPAPSDTFPPTTAELQEDKA